MGSLCIVNSCASIISRSRALSLFYLNSIRVGLFELLLTDVFQQHSWPAIETNRLLQTLDPDAESLVVL